MTTKSPAEPPAEGTTSQCPAFCCAKTAFSYTKEAIVGFAFGFAMEKSKVHLPSVITSQMQWTQLSMLVVFLTATLVGMVAVAVLEKFGLFKRSVKPPTSAGINALGAYGSNILGGAAVGAGMTLAGACPGTVFLQFGTGIPHGVFLLVGVLLGSVSYGYFHKWITTKFLPGFDGKSKAVTVDGTLTTWSLQKIAAVAAVIGFPLLFALDGVIPWRTDLFVNMVADFRQNEQLVDGVKNALVEVPNWRIGFNPYAAAWSPFSGGLAIGVVQVVHMVVTGGMIGLSSVFPYVGSVVVRVVDKDWQKNAPFYASYTGMANTLRFTVGVIAGAYVSFTMGGHVFGTGLGDVSVGAAAYDVATMVRVIVGGILLVYGSRCAGGCTSGHGLSGMAQLGSASIVTVAAMFGGGGLVALVMGGLPVYALN
ncbi:hypothetical protein HDU98_002290 [Podochytrium sp. JEL0797]|nr:hypothetical protein HDU98_002290 [Podochytrium sp. JEL0797]